jgi:hypothetical protein
VRVCAGGEPAGYTSPAGEETVWNGVASAGFRASFVPEGIDVRLVDPTGAVLHRRRFHPATMYAPLAGRLIRAADGTGFALLPADAYPLPADEIRLAFTFRRDNTLAVCVFRSKVITDSGGR